MICKDIVELDFENLGFGNPTSFYIESLYNTYMNVISVHDISYENTIINENDYSTLGFGDNQIIHNEVQYIHNGDLGFADIDVTIERPDDSTPANLSYETKSKVVNVNTGIQTITFTGNQFGIKPVIACNFYDQNINAWFENVTSRSFDIVNETNFPIKVGYVARGYVIVS